MRADSRDRHRRASSAFAGARRSISSSSGRRRRSSRGLVDALEAEGIAAFGPSAAAAALEGSKGFMKDLCAARGHPDRRLSPVSAMPPRPRPISPSRARRSSSRPTGSPPARASSSPPISPTAYRAVDAALVEGRFGAAGAEIVVEEFLDGEEASFFALVDGEDALPLAAAQDHKRVGDGDTGPNTGGMGAYSPAPAVTPAIEGAVMERIILPTVRAMRATGRPFKGVLYAGLMLTEAGPKLLEYNVRFGDPEAQALMMRLKSDLLPALIAARDGILQPGRSALVRRGGAVRRDGGQGLSRRPPARQRDPRPRSGGERPGDQDLPRRHRGARASASSPMAAASSASPRAAPTSPRRATAPTAPSTGSTGPTASAAAISAACDRTIATRQ